MNLIRHDIKIQLDDKIKEYERRLKQERILTLHTADHVEHLAAYIAWSNIGGNIFVKHATLPKEPSEYLDEKIKEFNVQNSILFHTSGTTGIPKIVINKEKHFYQSGNMATKVINWSNDTKFLNFLPAFTTGFWHIIMPTFIKHTSSTMVLGSRETIVKDLESDTNSVILVPALLDQLKMRGIPLNFSKYERVGCGASAPQQRHASIVFENGGNRFNNMYGASEICSPILSRVTTHIDDDPTYLNFESNGDSEIKLENNELCVRGPTVCETYTNWYHTGDLFEKKDNLIKFVGRNNEVIKINGYTASLLMIETTVEDRLGLGESRAVLRNRAGSDFIELEYTNKDAIIDKKIFHEKLESMLSYCCIPAKYTLVDSIPKNALGKKLRS